jgi:cysteinyl-tRNA synthetase
VNSLLDKEPELDFTVSIVARRGRNELKRCVASVRKWLPAGAGEIIVVDNGSEEGGTGLSAAVPRRSPRMRLLRADHFLGTAAGRNLTLRQARGRHVIFLDTSVELTGDVFGRLKALLTNETVGVGGKWGVVTSDLRQFTESPESGDVHAVEGYLMAMRRDVLREAGLLDERFRFYRHLDLDLSFAIRSRGYRAVIDADLPAVRHEHVEWEATPVEERDRLSKRNFYRFLHKWGERTDLIGRTG